MVFLYYLNKKNRGDFVQIDYNYLTDGLGSLSGLETQIYRKGKRIAHYAPVHFEPNISGLITNEIDTIKGNAYFLESETLLMFGVIHSLSDHITLIIGPCAQVRPNIRTIQAISKSLGTSLTERKKLQTYFEFMVPYPFETFLSILCFVNYFINKEKLSISDLIINHSKNRLNENIHFTHHQIRDDLFIPDEGPRNSYITEKNMLSYVRTGNMPAVKYFISQSPACKAGKIADNHLRQYKNTFICAATIISRAAIEGGMSAEAAFTLSDQYIKKVELLQSCNDIAALHMDILLEYTKRVADISSGREYSSFVKEVIRYIQENITKTLTTAKIAERFGLNRSHLCECFHKETGRTIGEFITDLRIKEAKRLLTTSDLSIAQISNLLGFSSQSHFSRVFKKETNHTPLELRRFPLQDREK